MLPSFEIPAAWKGNELTSRTDWRWVLDSAEIAELETALRATARRPLQELSPATFVLPTLSSKLASIQDSLEHGSGAALVRGFPVEAYDESEAERIFWGLTSHIGVPLSQSPAGERIFRVEDRGFAADDTQARGPNSRNRLSYHTDRCDVISFLCVRQAAEGGENFLVSSVAIYNRMLSERPDLVDVLLQPFRYQRHNVDSGNELPFYEQPIFSIYRGRFAANLLRVLIERAYAQPGGPRLTSLQREALDYIETLADQPEMHVRFRQQPGDFVLMNNWVTLHRRSEFIDHEAANQKRLLLRIWLSVPNSRAVDPRFAGSYGATEAGAVRGGMKPL